MGEFQRLVSESTGFIFYGPERFLGCMPPNMLAPMNITGDECVLTMSNDFTRGDWTRLSHGPWDLDNESALTMAQFIILCVWPVILPIQTDRWSPFHTPYYTFCLPTPTSPSTPILYQIFMRKIKTVHCFFTFYLVQVLCFTTFVCVIS